MAEIVLNTNSYVTLPEANQMVSDMYVTGSAELVKWAALPDSDKKIWLINSAKALNRLRYKGSKLTRGQPLAFPRKSFVGFGVGWMPFVSQYYDNTLIDTGLGSNNGLSEAKEAQVRNALAGIILDKDIITDVNERSVQGILSRRRNSVSESYDSGTKNNSSKLLTGLYNYEETKAILIHWFTDSVFTM